MSASFANEGKTQVGWVATIKQKAQKRDSVNNILPKGSPYCLPNSDEMIMRFSCLKAFDKYSGDGCA